VKSKAVSSPFQHGHPESNIALFRGVNRSGGEGHGGSGGDRTGKKASHQPPYKEEEKNTGPTKNSPPNIQH
jgi:hypothetical protein